MQLPLPKKIVVDDSTPAEMQGTVDNIGGIVNPFMSDVVRVLNQGINFDNTEFRKVVITVKTNASGAIIGSLDVSTGLNRLPYGHVCIDVKNTDNASTVPDITGTPFLLYTPNSQSSMRVSKILNLGNNGKYTITVVFF
jgi:hypothetical protein